MSYIESKIPKPYSINLRKKVIDHINKGHSANAAAIKFDIAANTARNGNKRLISSGNYEARKAPGKIASFSKEDFSNYVKKNNSATLSK